MVMMMRARSDIDVEGLWLPIKGLDSRDCRRQKSA